MDASSLAAVPLRFEQRYDVGKATHYYTLSGWL